MVPSIRMNALVAICTMLLVTGCKRAETPQGTAQVEEHKAPEIERLDPALDLIIPADSTLQRLAGGFGWVEGPVWVSPGTLMFADITSNSIRTMGPDGKATIWLQPSGYQGATPYGGKEPGTNGMTLDNKRRLTVAGHAARNIMRFETMDPKKPATVLADNYQGKKLNSPNDLVYAKDGSLYFTDPPYGLPTQSDEDPLKELKVNGVYRLPAANTQKPGSSPQGKQLQLLISDLKRPNGIALSPDNRWLYIADSELKKWMRYGVKSDGTLDYGALFLDASSDKRDGVPDGMKVDVHGNIYASGPGGIWIISPEGKHLGTILTTQRTANVAWGGNDGQTLYTATTDAVFAIHLKIAGYRP
jgi:gluconolactonase